jgi:hypothetical protein
MDFSDALRHVRAGRKVRRALWAELDGEVGFWVELVAIPPLPDGRQFAPMMLIWSESRGEFAPWTGAAGRDGLAGDWELAPAGPDREGSVSLPLLTGPAGSLILRN